VSAGATGQLPAGRRRPLDDLRHIFERELENVMQHERRPLGWRESFEDEEHRHPDAVVERDPVSRVLILAGGLDHGFRHPRADIHLAPRPRRTQLIEASPGHRDDEPAPDVLDLGKINPKQSCEGVLDDVLRLADAAKHPIGDIEHVAVVLAPDAAERDIG
jgi:hypothetical protein